MSLVKAADLCASNNPFRILKNKLPEPSCNRKSDWDRHVSKMYGYRLQNWLCKSL